MNQWYILYTKPWNEDRVESRLSGSGFEVLNPKIKVKKCIRNKIQEVLTPIFPCYLFVNLDIYKHYRLIKYTRGVRKVVGNDIAPSVVPEDVIASLQARMVNGVVKLDPPNFEKGEQVTIKSGYFQNFDAVFESNLRGDERVCILLTTINARVVIEKSMLARTGKAARPSN